MRCSFIALTLIAIFAQHASAQCVDPQVTAGTVTSAQIILKNVDFPDDSILQHGADDWNASGCGDYGSGFPEFTFGSQPSGDARFVEVHYDSGIGPGECGSFSGSSITLYGFARAANDPSVIASCTPVIQETFEHELGHVLGLGDSGCNGYIMDGIRVDSAGNYNSRSIHSDECAAVDKEYKTPDEVANELDLCNQTCPSGCRGVPPTCQPPPPTFDTGCPDCGSRGYSPIVLALDGGYQLTGTSNPVSFDINADGERDIVSWTARGSRMAFLVMDRNHNGTIDDGSELFGDSTRLVDGTRASNGFEALRQLDSNGDGVVDAQDEAWQDLALWIDANHDGISQPEELMSLDSAGITALHFSYHWTGRRDRSGNVFRWEAQYEAGHKTHTYYDIYFFVKH